MGGFRLSHQTSSVSSKGKDVTATAGPHATAGGSDASTEPAASAADQLELSRRTLKRTRHQLRLQETRSRQLVTACAAKLQQRQTEAEQQLQLKDSQFQHILQQLALLQSRLMGEQKTVTSRLQEQEQARQQQARELERLRRINRRLLGKVQRLSAPCSQCGTKPDSGISDCEDEDGGPTKLAKTSHVTGSPDSALNSSEGTGSEPASPPVAERGIMKTTRQPRSSGTKTVTFSLSQDKENAVPPQPQPRRPQQAPPSPARSRTKPPLPLKPRLIMASQSNGAAATQPPTVVTIGQPSISDAINQLLAHHTEKQHSADNEQENGEAPTPAERLSVRDADAQNLTAIFGTNEQCLEVPLNMPRSRSNINLIMSEQEGVKIKDNFEEFKLEENVSNRTYTEGDTCTSASCGEEDDYSLDREAGDGAENEVIIPVQAPQPALRITYDKFLEQSGLSQKNIRTPKRLFTNHRSMLKPSDIKYRHRTRITFDGSSGDDMSPTSVRYYSEQL